MGFADFIYATLTFALQRPMDVIPPVLAFLAALAVVLFTMPPLIRKMRDGGMRGPGNQWAPPSLAAISVFFIASMIGLIDDISNIRQRVKAVAVVFASLPLLLVHFKNDGSGVGTIDIVRNAFINIPGIGAIDLRAMPLSYWFVLVPMGVTGVANAMNMSAGYNGLESGQITIVGGSLFVVSIARGTPESTLIFAALLGVSIGMFWFNRYPARVFIGDIGKIGGAHV